MKKLEDLEKGAGGLPQRTGKEEPRLRQWLKSLKSNPLKEPETEHDRAFDELVEAPVPSITAGKPETNH